MPTPDRFATSRSTLLVDRFMNGFIKVGGLGIIAAVFAIFIFILVQILPLFQGADVKALAERGGATVQAVAFGVDEWGELPFTIDTSGELRLLPLAGGGSRTFSLGLAASEHATCARYDQKRQVVTVGTSIGRMVQAELHYRSHDGQVTAEPEVTTRVEIGAPGAPVIDIGYGEGAEARLAVALQNVEGKLQVHAVRFHVTRSMMGGGKVEEDWRKELTPLLAERPERILVDDRAEQVVVSDSTGSVTVLKTDDEGAEIFQPAFRPFADLPDPRIATIDFLLGDVSLVVTAKSGANRILSQFIDPRLQRRQYARTKDFPDLRSGAGAFAASSRNKAFLVADGREVSLRYATSETVRWQGETSFPVRRAVISGKYHRILLLDDQGGIHALALDDPHPEAGIKAFFGKVWYEGADAPKYEWQSSGTDDSEPKLSLVPLIFGTLKGTFYAMLFAVPIALLGAIYTAEFMHPRYKTIVKPTVEVMASLPSVVLGFLGALWMAPLIEDRVPSLLLVLVGVPTTALGCGWLWTRLPEGWRALVRPGSEFLLVLVPVVLAALGLWALGPAMERLLFSCDFRTWWPRVTGASFEQRNSLIVGFMMGFAVIPIIFTIVEDALTNVPQALRSGSLALGASRWQTAMRVVVPTASAGILSALMIGLGRAIGETMIVVMATGNTPIMDFDIFNGMRTLSANIAVELPEAPHGGTLYRTLYLGAMLLFLMTFAINTLAEVLRSHLREKYKTV